MKQQHFTGAKAVLAGVAVVARNIGVRAWRLSRLGGKIPLASRMPRQTSAHHIPFDPPSAPNDGLLATGTASADDQPAPFVRTKIMTRSRSF